MRDNRKIIMNLTFAFILYSILFSEDGIIGNIFSNKMKVSGDSGPEKEVKLEGNFAERFLSRVFINAIKTPQGYDLLSRYIHNPIKGDMVLKLSDQINFAKRYNYKEIK